MDEQANETDVAIEKKPRRRRTGKKRVVFKIPAKPAPAVKELWRQASEEEQQRAHVTCASVLEYGLGKTTKAELAERLDVPLLRVWQLSQLAVSGMLAGLLKQPRGRGAKRVGGPLNEVKALRKENDELREKLCRTEELVRILRDFPANRASPPSVSTDSARGSKSRSKKTPPARKKKAKRAPRSHPRTEASDRGDGVGREQTPPAG